MKKFLLLVFYTCFSFSQSEYQSFNVGYDAFAAHAKPSKDNALSEYFKKKIDSKLLDSYQIIDTLKSEKNIFLTFRFDKSNKVNSIIVDSPYSELNKSIRNAFKKYDIESLNIPEIIPSNKYKLQILSKEENKMVINCSTHVVYDKPAIFEGCELCVNNVKISNCIYEKLQQHIAKTISKTEIKKAKILGLLYLKIQFLINEQGVIEQINCKAPTENLTQELNRVISLFPNAKFPATLNSKPTTFLYNKTITLEIDSDNEKYIEEIEKLKEENLKLKDSTLNPNSALALHFKNYISPDELDKIVFPLKYKRIYISFRINKKGKPINITTNLEVPKLNERLVEIFNEFPFEKLNIKSTNSLETYRYPIIYKQFNKNSIQSTDKPITYIPPIFDEKCKKSKNPDELYKRFRENINEIVNNNFRRRIKYLTKLSGTIRISCSFKINASGEIIDVKATAPNPVITSELEEIIKKIAKVYQPAYLNQEPITTSHRYSFSYSLGNNEVDN